MRVTLSLQHRVTATFVAVLLALQLVACGTTPDQTSSTEPTRTSYQPITIQNCGFTTNYTQVPARVLSTNQVTTDILLKLGLQDHIAGILYADLYTIEPGFDYTKLNNLGGTMVEAVSKEKIIELRPDFVFSANPNGDFDPAYGMTREQFGEMDAEIYGMSQECSHEATQEKVGSLYNDILNIGKIFAIEGKAQQLVDDMKSRIDAVQQKIVNRPLVDVITVPHFSVDTLTAPVTVVGPGFFSDLLRQAGGNNLFGNEKSTYPAIGQETLAAKKPQVYVEVRYKGADTSRLTSYLYSTYPNSPAVEQKRLVSIEGHRWNAGIYLPDTIEQLARAFHPEAFA